jgi:trimethylamine--corrinoid protein Co-methyltransferase
MVVKFMITPVKWKTQLELLSQKDLQLIHSSTLKVLKETGIVMPLSKERLEQVLDLGVKTDTSKKRLFFDPELVENVLSKVPSNYTLYARNPEYDLPLDGLHGYLTLDGCGIKIKDLDTGEIRNSTKEDLENAIRVADYLPQISFLWPTICAGDKTSRIQPMYEFCAMLLNSSKHIQAMTAVDPLNAKGTVELAQTAVGGKDNLKKRPILSNFQCSISPLSYDEKGIEAACIFAEAGIPVGFMTMQIGCSTAPATLAGNLVLGNAEILAGILLIQLLYPGTPTFYGSCATVMELKRGGVTCGGPEDFLLQAASAQLARYYKIPSNIGTFATGAKSSNWHAGVENSISGAVSMFSKADMMCGAGLINGATIFSYEQLLLDCEIYNILKAVVEGFPVNSDTLAVDVIHKVGAQNHYMLEEHTVRNLHNFWQPLIIDRSPYDEWILKGKPTAQSNARQLAKEILDIHQPIPVSNPDILQEIIDEYDKASLLK